MKNLEIKVEYKAQSFFYYLYHLIKASMEYTEANITAHGRTNKQTNKNNNNKKKFQVSKF